MKRILFALTIAASCAFAQEPAKKDSEKPAGEAAPVQQQTSAEKRAQKAPWPVWLAFNSTRNIDVVGCRLNLAYGACEGLTGFDLGVFGRCRYMEGFQFNILRNAAEDTLAGIQLGIYNSAGRADMFGLQIGLWNEVHSVRGMQVGLVNVASSVSGFQIGLINRSESLYGVQVGAVNVIRSAEFPFMPLVNIGFESFGSPAF